MPMKFRTAIAIAPSQNPITHDSRVFLAGSCFAEHMAERLAYHGFQVQANPFGILFQPQALARMLDWAVQGKIFGEDDVFFHLERWHCLHAHSELSHQDREVLLARMNDAVTQTRNAVQNATHVVFTLGTAWVYHHVKNAENVANCHKLPQDVFEKRLLSVAEVAASVRRMTDCVVKLNPSAQIVFTVSPVRHLKDGFVGNQRSKAHLIAGLHEALEGSAAHYFPAYELLLDDLRDYRFYADDLLHPNAAGVQYIWEAFASGWIASESAGVMREVVRIRKALAHRAFDETSAQHQKFREGLMADALALTQRYPHLDFQNT